jgi:transcriptional regulator with XRE-family HTH domain
MSKLRLRSVEEPLDLSAAASEAVRFLSVAEQLGLFPDGLESIETLDLGIVRAVLKEAAAAGVGRQALAEAESGDGKDVSAWVDVLVRANAALAESPIPDRTWPVLADHLGIDLLARLVGIARASARRYLTGERATPDAVAARLHWIALIVGDLAGSYNEFGIRRWFVRPRSQLDGKAPADVLAGEWSPDDAGPRTVRVLATSLVDAGAT